MIGFFEDLPPAKCGKWEAVVLETSPMRGTHEVCKCRVSGLRRAYFVVRLMAFWKDLTTPYMENGHIIGIDWALRYVKQETSKPIVKRKVKLRLKS